jgi:hypothetical protein
VQGAGDRVARDGTTSELPEPASEPNLGHDVAFESDAAQDAPTGEQESSDVQAD